MAGLKKKKKERKKKEAAAETSTLKPKFSVHSLWEKNPPNLQYCLEGEDSLLRLLRTPKLKYKYIYISGGNQTNKSRVHASVSNVSLCFLQFFCHRRFKSRENDFHRSSDRMLDRVGFFGGVVDAVERISLEREGKQTRRRRIQASPTTDQIDMD